MNEPRIGYQGIPGSNSEYAAVRFARQLELESYELIPLVTSKGVADALRGGWHDEAAADEAVLEAVDGEGGVELLGRRRAEEDEVRVLDEASFGRWRILP